MTPANTKHATSHTPARNATTPKPETEPDCPGSRQLAPATAYDPGLGDDRGYCPHCNSWPAMTVLGLLRRHKPYRTSSRSTLHSSPGAGGAHP